MSRPRRIAPALAFALGFAVALPLVARPSLLGPVCSRTGATGAYVTLQVTSATRNGTPVAAPTDFTPAIQNVASSDASRLTAVLMDVGDTPTSTPTFPTLIIRRLP